MSPIGKLLVKIGVFLLFGKIYAMRTRNRALEEELRKQRAYLDYVTYELEGDLFEKGATLYPWKAKEMGFRLVKKNELTMVWNTPKTEIYRE